MTKIKFTMRNNSIDVAGLNIEDIVVTDNGNTNTLKNYILIHLDEKFVDIQNIEKDLTNSIKYLSKKTNKRIIITSFNNEHEYYKNLKIKKINFRDMNNKKELEKMKKDCSKIDGLGPYRVSEYIKKL